MEIKSITDLVLAKKYMLHYVQDERAMRLGLKDHHVLRREVRFVGAWMKKRGVVDGARRIKSLKQRENQ